MKFIKVKVWSWKHFFSGQQAIATDLSATEQQVRSWIGQQTSRGGHGNYDPTTLTCKEMKVKERRTEITKL
jgi:hypothetical protein